MKSKTWKYRIIEATFNSGEVRYYIEYKKRNIFAWWFRKILEYATKEAVIKALEREIAEDNKSFAIKVKKERIVKL